MDAALPHPLKLLAGRLNPAHEPIPRGALDAWKDLRLSAVLVLLYPDRDGIRFPLTLRPETLRTHAGQVALPGGRVEGGESPWAAALRETEEEIGIPSDQVEPLGRLDLLPTVAGTHLVVPYVGWTPRPPRIIPQPSEVAEVIEAGVERLLDRSAIEEERWEFRGRDCLVTFYRIGGHVVWGITARILSDLAERLEPGLPPPDPRPGSVRPA
jgi:8-oxo-dGTP pyrophosphatase MutT (NUDIX family)